MTQTALKKELHKAIDNTDDDTLLEAIYTLLNSKPSRAYKLSPQDLKILEEQETLYKAGKLKTHSLKEVKKRVRKNLE